VSKWERGECLPDITMVLPIASYFNVSTDELLGLDAAKNEAKVEEYLRNRNELQASGRWDLATELIKKAHEEFPNEFRITNWYVQMIIGGNADNPPELVLAHADEITALCERILGECTVDYIRYNAIDMLAKVEKARGNPEKALELLDQLGNWYVTKSQKSEQLFAKDTDEFWYWINRNFYELAYFALNKLEKIIWYSKKTFGEKVAAAEKIIEYELKILGDTGYEPLYDMIASSYGEIGRQHHIAGRYDEVAKYYDRELSYAKKFDDFIASDRQISGTQSNLKRDLFIQRTNADKWNSVKRRLIWKENSPWLEPSRQTESFQAMLEKHRPFASEI